VGVDITGLNPKNEKGEQFSSNWWDWRPIWAFTVLLCGDILDEELEMTVEDTDGETKTIKYYGWEAGHSNNGYIIPEGKAEEIGKRIIEVLKPKEDVAEEVADGIKGGLAEEIAQKIKELLNPKDYTLDMEFLREWAEFCLNCGGFEVY